MKFFFSFIFMLTISVTALSNEDDYVDYSHIKYTKVGPLKAMVIENVKGAPYVVYLHGFGGTGESAFYDLNSQLSTEPILRKVNWIFPDSPNQERGWFDIMAQTSDGEPDLKKWQATLKSTRAVLTKMIKSAKIDPRNIIWAGFSQGAIAAADYVLHASTSSKGLIMHSGLYFNSTDWKPGSKQLIGIKFFMSHDPNDEYLPFDEAKKAEVLFQKNGMIGKIETHTSGHTNNPFDGFLESAIEALIAPPTQK